jgi:hypothetical protein
MMRKRVRQVEKLCQSQGFWGDRVEHAQQDLAKAKSGCDKRSMLARIGALEAQVAKLTALLGGDE